MKCQDVPMVGLDPILHVVILQDLTTIYIEIQGGGQGIVRIVRPCSRLLVSRILGGVAKVLVSPIVWITKRRDLRPNPIFQLAVWIRESQIPAALVFWSDHE